MNIWRDDELNYLMNKSRAELQGEKLREILRQMAVKNIRRYNRGEEE